VGGRWLKEVVLRGAELFGWWRWGAYEISSGCSDDKGNSLYISKAIGEGGSDGDSRGGDVNYQSLGSE